MSTYMPRPARVGAKYTGWIDAAIAAKEIRKDIKSAQKNGQIPVDVKVSVKTRKYAGGQAIDVVLTGWNSEAVWGPCVEERSGMTYAAKRVWDKIEEIRSAFNRNDSDLMTDYFDVVYYGTTKWGVYPWSE